MTIIKDNINVLKFACEDLESLRSAAQVVEAEKSWSSERDMLAVTIRALTPIIDDIHEAIDNIDKALKEVRKDEGD